MPRKRECHAEQRGASKEDRGKHSVRFKSNTAAPIPCSSHLWKRATPFSQGSLLASNYCFIARASELLSGPISGIMASAMHGSLPCTGGVYMSSSCSPGTLCSLGTPWSHNLCKWQCTWANHVWHQEQTTTVCKYWQVMSNQGLQEWWSPTPHGSGVKAAFWLGVRLELWRTSYHLRLWWIQLVHTAVGWPPEMWKYTRNTIHKCKNS